MAQYPSIHLPAMPRKALFVGETDIRERRVAFDELVRFISKHLTLSACPELMEFLGEKLLSLHCIICIYPISVIRFPLHFIGAKGALHDVKASNTPDVAADENEDDGLDFFGKDEVPTAQPERVKKPVKVEKAAEEEEEEEEELFDPLGSVR